MSIDRRAFMTSAIAAAATGLTPKAARSAAGFAPSAWRVFETVTRVDIAESGGKIQAWLPLPSFSDAEWIRPGTSRWTTNAVGARVVRDQRHGAEMLHLVWADDEKFPVAEVTSTVATRDRAIDFGEPRRLAPLPAASRALYLAATDLIPTDGIVKDTATRIVAGADSDLAKARAIYEWVVDNTTRNAATRGCGVGDVAAMLKTGNLSGKCADLNALFVGLARSAGLPARDLYGLRVAPSRLGYKSLGIGSAIATKAQHCRAEVWLESHGWVPVDPADVRKVMLEEPPGNLAVGDVKVAAARKALFGSWETNWLAYNDAHDLHLPGSDAAPVGFLMYPHAESGNLRLDSLAPDTFRYTISAREIPA